MSDVSQGAGWWLASDGKWYPPAQAPLPPPPPSPPPGSTPPGTAPGKRNWKAIGLIVAGVFVALMVVGAVASPSEEPESASPGQTTTTISPDAKAVAEGNVARCNDGGYSDNTDFSATCSGGDGIDKWLAPFGECTDGTIIKMGPDASCDDNDGFDRLLAADYEPTAAKGDVARCKDGTFSDNTDFSATCSSRDGVSLWLAPYGKCKDGTVFKLGKKATCKGHQGFSALMPKDYVPPTTTTTAAPPTTAAPTMPPQDPADEAVRRWALSAYPQIDQLTTVMQGISDAALAYDFDATRSQCSQLRSEVAGARNLGPIPIEEAQTHWQRSLDLLDRAGERCITGIDNVDAAALSEAADLTLEASNELALTTEAVEAYID
jgi:hypothetical protein